MSFITFGEIMLRLTPAEPFVKIKTSRNFETNYAGSESNVASSLAILGNDVNFITKLPVNQLGDGALSSLQSFGIQTNYIVRGGTRIGAYFIEQGSSIRPSSVIYDRANSAISEIKANEFDWETILSNKKWIFLSGITPVLSKQCALETIKAAKTAQEKGVKVAFDMNYRRTLWKNAANARKIFNEILEYTDVLFGNEGVLKDVYDISPSGNSSQERTQNAMGMARKKFGINELAFTSRDQISASKNKLSGLYLANQNHFVTKPISVSITDRFGTGDAFAAAFLHATHLDWNPQKTIDFATAAFALKHTINGDQHTSDESEILAVMDGYTKGHVIR
ncbi:PfkB family carbohydrate kinase [Maribacter sp. CXY002]|uniref:PfkB family carbohydrate kinase n=1 Tax=Maribacter luteocoastalis TaxID=3407671 RepID=UPI003B681CE2